MLTDKKNTGLLGGAVNNWRPPATRADRLDEEIKNAPNEFVKIALQNKKKARNEYIKNKNQNWETEAQSEGQDPTQYIMQQSAKFDAAQKASGIDRTDYILGVANGKIQDPTINEQQQKDNSPEGIMGKFIDEVKRPAESAGAGALAGAVVGLGVPGAIVGGVVGLGAGIYSSVVNKDIEDSNKTMEATQDNMIKGAKALKEKLDSTKSPKERDSLNKQITSFKRAYQQIDRIKEEANNSFGAQYAKSPLGATSEFLFGNTEKTLKEGYNVLKGKPIEKKSFPRRLAQWSMSILEVATLGAVGAGTKAVEKTAGKELLAKYGMEKAIKVAVDNSSEKWAEGMAKAVGKPAAEELAKGAIDKTLKEKLAEISVNSSTKKEFTKEAGRMVGKEVAKKIGKSLVSKTSLEAMTMGAGFSMGSAVKNGETNTSKILNEGWKGALIGLGLEKSFKAIGAGNKYIKKAEGEATASLNSLGEKVGRKITFKEYVQARRKAYTPENVRDYTEALDNVEKNVMARRAGAETIAESKINKANAEYSGKKAVISDISGNKEIHRVKRIQEEKDMISKLRGERRLVPQSDKKELMVIAEEKPVDYPRIFKRLGAEDFNIDNARKNYVKQTAKVLPEAYKGNKEAIRELTSLNEDWKKIAPYYKDTLSDRVFNKKTSESLSALEKAKDVRTIIKAKQKFNSEDINNVKISPQVKNEYYNKLNELIDKKKSPDISWGAKVSELTDKKIGDEIKILSPKEGEKGLKEKTSSDKGLKRFVELTQERRKRELISEKAKPAVIKVGKLTSKKEFVKRIQELARRKKAIKVEIDRKISNDEIDVLSKKIDENPDMEFSVVSNGVELRNQNDLNIFKKANDLAEKPYSLTQLAYDTRNTFIKYAEKIGRSIKFKEGVINKKSGKGNIVVGEYHQPFDVARTLKENDFSTTVHEFTHFATTEKAGFDINSISRNAKAELNSYFGDSIREGYAKAMELLATDPNKAVRAMPNVIGELKTTHLELFNAIKEANNHLGKLQGLNPQDALRGFQTPLEKQANSIFKDIKEKGVLKTIKNRKGKIVGFLRYMDSLGGRENAMAGMFDTDTTIRINKQIVGGSVTPYNSGFINENELIHRVGKEKATRMIDNLKKNYALPDNYKSFNQLVIEGGKNHYDNIKGGKGLTGKKNYKYMMDTIGDWMLLKHTQERKTLVGMFSDKTPRTIAEEKLAKANEIKLANISIARIEKKNPWAKTEGEKFFKWWKDSTNSVVELYKDVYTPEERIVLTQKLYKDYFPIVRRDKGDKIFKKSEGGTGLIKPAMEGFAGKMNAITKDLSLRRGKSMLVKALKDLKKTGVDLGTFEDITKPMSKEQLSNWKRLEKISGMTDDELSSLSKEDITKKLGGLKDIYHEGKFLDNGIMYLVEDGKRKVYEIDPLLAKMFKNSNNPIWGALTSSGAEKEAYFQKYLRENGNEKAVILLKGMNYAMKPLIWSVNTAKAGITFSANFMFNNFIRDPFTMILRYKGMDKFNIKPGDKTATKVAKSIANHIYTAYATGTSFAVNIAERTSRINLTENSKEYKAMTDMIFAMGKMDVNMYANEGEMTSMGGAYDTRLLKGFYKEKVKYVFEKALGLSEGASRKSSMEQKLREFVKQGGDLENLNPQTVEDLVQFGNEITINWSSKGTLSQYLKLAPFGRATLTATAQDLRFVVENPVQVAVRTSAVLLPITLGFYINNHRTSGTTAVWNEIGKKTKQNYWLIIMGKNKDGTYKIGKLAKPKEIAMVGVQALEDTLDNFSRINPKEGYNMNNALFDSLTNGAGNLIQNGIGADYISQLNPLVLSGIEEATNKKLYWGGTVVPPTYQKEEKLAQKNNYTSLIAKTIAKTMGWSPMVVDNYIKNIGGTVGRNFAVGTSIQHGGSLFGGFKSLGGSPTETIKNATRIKEPIGYYSRDVKQFYSEFDKINKKYNSRKNYKLANAVKISKYHATYLGIKSQISAEYKRIKSINNSNFLSDKQKKDRVDKLNKRILGIVVGFNKNSKSREEFLTSNLKMK